MCFLFAEFKDDSKSSTGHFFFFFLVFAVYMIKATQEMNDGLDRVDCEHQEEEEEEVSSAGFAVIFRFSKQETHGMLWCALDTGAGQALTWKSNHDLPSYGFQVNVATFALLFSEIVQYCQNRVYTVPELQAK